jgi:hypothetical protein
MASKESKTSEKVRHYKVKLCSARLSTEEKKPVSEQDNQAPVEPDNKKPKVKGDYLHIYIKNSCAFLSRDGKNSKVVCKDEFTALKFALDVCIVEELVGQLGGNCPFEDNLNHVAKHVLWMTYRYGPKNISKPWRKLLWLQDKKDDRERFVFGDELPDEIADEELAATIRKQN